MEEGDPAGSLLRRVQAARAASHFVVLQGFHALKHAARFGARIEAAWCADPTTLIALATDLAPDLVAWLETRVEPVPAELLRAAAPLAGDASVLALARRPAVDPSAVLADPDDAPVVLLERPTHAGNLGAVVRVAAAAGAAGVLTTGTLDPWHSAVLRAAAGLHFAIPVARLSELPRCDRPLIAIDPEGVPLSADAVAPRAILAFGSERHGLSDDLVARADARLAIAMRPGVSSLNLATAAAVVLYARRGRGAGPLVRAPASA